jgi:hypothetical protein
MGRTTAHPNSHVRAFRLAVAARNLGMPTTERPSLLRWQLGPDKAGIFAPDGPITEMVHTQEGHVQFAFAGHAYILRHSGVWKVRTLIERDGVEVLRTGSSGLFKDPQVVLREGGTYTARWTNSPLVKLALLDVEGTEVLSLRLATEGGVHITTVVPAGWHREERTVLLLAYAYSLFGGIMRGEGAAEALLGPVV